MALTRKQRKLLREPPARPELEELADLHWKREGTAPELEYYRRRYSRKVRSELARDRADNEEARQANGKDFTWTPAQPIRGKR